MNEIVEVEYKILLEKDIFHQIKDNYQNMIKDDYEQTNYYLTHPLLEEKAYMLRIREKKGRYELTLKRPYQGHRLETNIDLSIEEKDAWLNHHPFPNAITDILIKEGIQIEDVVQQFSLTTHRYDIPLQEGVLSLDENTYLGMSDYELEFEVYDEKKGYQQFLNIIEPFHLHYQGNCLSKIQRVLAHL